MKLLTNMMISEVLSDLGFPPKFYEGKIPFKGKKLYRHVSVSAFSNKAKYNKYRKLLTNILGSKTNRRILTLTLSLLVKTRLTKVFPLFSLLFKVLYNRNFNYSCESHRDKIRRLLNVYALLLLIDPYSYYDYGNVILTPLGYVLYHHLNYDNPSNYDVALTFPGDIVLKGKDLFSNVFVKVYHEYIVEYWKPLRNKRAALFTPCSNVKPIPKSFMNVKIDGILRKYCLEGYVDRYIVSEPLVLIPYRFAYYFPAAHYDYHPSMVSSEERRVYVELLRKVIEDRIAKNYDRIVYSLPRFHKRIFEEAIGCLDVEAVYVPYNVYYLPKLKETLLRLVRE